MNRRLRWLACGMVVVLGLTMAVVTNAETTTNTSTTKVATQTGTTKVTTAVAVKLNQEQATQIVLKVHKGATVSEVKLEKNIYVVHLQTDKGVKRLVQVGGNTGRILKDSLDNAVASSK